jgi:hypothetical protein
MLDPLFEESYIEGSEYTGPQQQSHLENIVDSTNIFCSNNNINGTEAGKMRGDSPDTACKVTDSADFYQGFQAQSYPTEYSEEHDRLAMQGNYDVPYCAKIMDTTLACEERNPAYDRQYLANKRTKYTGKTKLF